MAIERFRIKQGTLKPALRATLQQGDGTAIDLTGCTVKFRMRSRRTNAVKVNLVASTIITPASGIVEYRWQGTATDTLGTFSGEFEVTFSGGEKLIAPATAAREDGSLEIEVTEPFA